MIKNSHFWFYPHETLWKWLSHEVMIFIKFHEDMTKNVDFLLLANFRECLVSIFSDFSRLAADLFPLWIFTRRRQIKPHWLNQIDSPPMVLWSKPSQRKFAEKPCQSFTTNFILTTRRVHAKAWWHLWNFIVWQLKFNRFLYPNECS